MALFVLLIELLIVLLVLFAGGAVVLVFMESCFTGGNGN